MLCCQNAKEQIMGLKALVDYTLIRELCDNLSRDGDKFTGRVKPPTYYPI